MISSRALKVPSRTLKISPRRPQLVHQHRIYAISAPRLLSTRPLLQPVPRNTSRWRTSLGVSQSIINLQGSRFSSTNSVAPSGPEEPLPVPTEEFIPSPIEDITSNLPLIPEKIGYLKELGLDYGWGSTALVEYLLEHVHIYTATPWWASIVLTALIVRLALLKGYISAADTSARMVTITDLQMPIKARIDAAKAAQDSAAFMQGTQEIKALYRQAGIKVWKLGIPLLQVPIGFGTFRLLKGMAGLPVPALEDGGLLWLKDLTISDPYFILPVLTGVCMYYTFKAGGELGSNSMNPMFHKIALYAMPIMTVGFMLLHPACVQLTFGFTAALSLAQSYLLRQPRVRELLGIYPLPKRLANRNVVETVATPLNMYQPPSQPPLEPEIRGGIASRAKAKYSEVKGAASEFRNSMTGIIGTKTREATKSQTASSELTKAQQLQEKRLYLLAQAESEADQQKKNPAARQKRSRKERR